MSTPSDRLIAAASQTVGPFFHFGLTTNPGLGCLVRAATSGERITLRVRALDGDGVPVPDAMIEIYQADAAGVYPPARTESAPEPAFCGFGRLGTDRDGWCAFQTVRPGRVADGRGGYQASHVNVCFFSRGLLRHLYTRIYFGGDPALGGDTVLAFVPESRRATLLAHAAADAPGVWEFTIRLQGDEETVFFDL